MTEDERSDESYKVEGAEHGMGNSKSKDAIMSESSEESYKVEEAEHGMGISKSKDAGMSERVNVNEVRDKECGSKSKTEEPKYHFQNKKRKGSTLVISRKDYHLLVRGCTIQHFNFKSGISMSIRVIDTPQVSPKSDSRSQSQLKSHSPSMQQCEPTPLRLLPITSEVSSQDERSMLIETSLSEPEESKLEQQFGAATIPQSLLLQVIFPNHNPNFIQSFAMGNRSFSLHSITTGNRSSTRRTSTRAPASKDVKKKQRIISRNQTCVLSNYVFQCRSKVEATTKNIENHPLDSHNLLSPYRHETKISFPPKSRFTPTTNEAIYY